MELTPSITTQRQLLTTSWAGDVDRIETAVERFPLARTITNSCAISFFEMPGDRELHVNVTHAHRTASPAGWAGPGATPAGFVHNRRFADATPDTIVRRIRSMVFAARA